MLRQDHVEEDLVILLLLWDKGVKGKLEIRELYHATPVRKEYVCLLISIEGLFIKHVTFF